MSCETASPVDSMRGASAFDGSRGGARFVVTSRVADLGFAFIQRARAATLILAVVGSPFVAVYAGWMAGGAWLAGAAVSILNFRVLEYILVHLLRPEPKWTPGVAAALLLKLPMLLAALFVSFSLLHFPTLWFALGFFLLFAVIVLKALSRIWIATRARNATREGSGTGASADGVGGSMAHRVRQALAEEDPDAGLSSMRKGKMLGLIVGLVLGIASLGTLGTVGLQMAAEHFGIAETPSFSSGVAAPALAQDDPAHDEPGLDPQMTHDEVADEPHETDLIEQHGDEHGSIHDDEAHGEHDDHGAHEGQYHFPTLIWYLKYFIPDAGWVDFLLQWENVFFALVVAGFLSIVAYNAQKRPQLIPSGLQNVVEFAVESFDDFVRGIIGPEGRRYVPFIGTLFFYIWFMNLFGLVPGGKSPTSVFNTTFALAITVFLYVQFIALTRSGPIKYMHHLAGEPRDAAGWAVVPLQFPLHIIGELAKPVSLSLRLFGNIMGEDTLLALFAGLGVAVLAFQPLPIGLPLHLPFMFLALLASTVQALIFSLLTTIYIFQVLPHEEHEEAH